MCEKRRYSIRVELTHPTRIATYEIKEVPNGTDQKLFIQNPKWEPFTLQLTEKRLPNVPGLLCGQLTFLSQKLTKIELQHLLHVWLLAMFFPERFKTRPILAAIGPKGSGKTTLIDQIGKILFGSAFKVAQLTDDPKDLDAALTSEFFVAIDNADRNINWLPDKLAVIATGGTIKRRTYYTTNKLVEFPLKAWVGITSRTPHFKREDVADRLLPFHIQRIPEFAAFHDIEQEVLQKHNLLLTALVRNVQIVLRHLSVKDTKRFQTTFRMVDYAYFVHL